MLLAIAAFEWRYATRRPLLPLAALLLAAFGFVLGAQGFMAADIHVNAPYAVTMGAGFLALVSVFASTVLVAPSLLRDTEHRFAEILYATGLTKTDYLLGRLLGSWTLSVGAWSCGLLGLLAGEMRADGARLPFGATVYLQALAFALPTLAFVAALLFAVAALTRSTLATYVAGVSLYVLYFAVSVAVGSPLLANAAPVSAEQLARGALIDPFGLTAVFAQSHHWTVAQRDTSPIRWAGPLLWNRVGWSLAAAALVAFAHRAFAFRVASGSKGAAPAAEPATAASWVSAAPQRDRWRPGLLSAARLEAASQLRAWPFVAVCVLWLATAVITILEEVRRTEFGTAQLPAGGLLVVQLLQPLQLFGLLVLVYFSGEIVWRERTVGFAEIVDATPAPRRVFLLSKLIAMAALVAVLVVLGILAGLGVQVAADYGPLEIGTHAALLAFGGWPLLVFAALAVLLQTLAPHRHVGLVLVLAAALLLPMGGPGSPENPLLRYASGPPVLWSAMTGFGPSAWSFVPVMAYWSALAALLLLVAARLWRRGTDTRLTIRLRRFGSPLVPLAGALVVVASGTLLWRQMRTAHGWESASERLARRAAYERTYGALAGLPTPAVAHVTLAIDVVPEERRFSARGTYRLENRSARPIAPVLVTVPRGVHVSTLTLDGRAGRQDAGTGAWTFEASLPPGASAELAFDLDADRRGVSAAPVLDVVENGSFLFGPRFLPAPGYRRAQEIDDEEERREAGLGPRRPAPGEDPLVATFDLTVSTAPDQIAVGPGDLVGEWQQGGRAFRRYASARPVPLVPVVASARYAVQSVREGAVQVEVLYEPRHRANVERIAEAATASLRAFGARFGPYPWSRLRIVEVPPLAASFGGYAVPATVFLVEDRAFLTDARDNRRVDIVTKRTAHEVAHQWWGHQVTPANGPGASAIVETLTRYSELIVLEGTRGREAIRPVLEVELGRYLAGRGGDTEPPLAKVDDEAWIYYAKGVLVMRALRDLVGADALDRALHAFAAGASTAPNVSALLRELRNATPADRQDLLEEWWNDVVLYDLGVTAAHAQPAPGGWTVELDVALNRTRAVDGRDVPADAPREIEIAFYADDPVRAGYGNPLVLERRVVSGPGRLVFTLSQAPAFVALDPRLHFIDRNPADNVREIARR